MLNKNLERAVPARWGSERRLEFIDFRLLWEGTINRSELVGFFGISTQQASADISRYIEQTPGNLTYDKSAKTYKVTELFRPLVSRSNARHYLDQLQEISTNDRPPSSLFIGWRPPCDVVKYPSRPVETTTLLRILWAIRDHEELSVAYQSMRHPTTTLRWLSPHALASDGLRWHVRAWCHENMEFRDFVLSRIQKVLDSRESEIDATTDERWHSYIDVIVKPRAELSADQRGAIETDYGMKNGRLVLNCRKALAFYVIRQLQLERPYAATPAEQPLELENEADLRPLIAAGTKSTTTKIIPLTQN